MADHELTLRALLQPGAIALIGASRTPGKLGQKLLHNLESRFDGPVHAVNPRPPEDAAGSRIRWWTSTDQLPAGVDLAIVIVPPQQVWDALDALARVRVGAVAVLADRLPPRAPDRGGDARADLREYRRRTGIRVLGPNTSGIRDLSRGLVATFAGDTYRIGPSGGIDLISQSGGALAYLGGTLLRQRNCGLRWVIDTGNEADVTAAECLRQVVAHGADRVGLVLEGCPDWRELHSALAAAAARDVRVVALQLGHSDRGREVAASHTGALVGSHGAFRVVLESHGAVVAEDETEFVDALTLPRLPANRRVVVGSFSGGLNVLLSDLLSGAGFQLPAVGELVSTDPGSTDPAGGDQPAPAATPQTHPIDFGPWALREPELVSSTVLACAAAADPAAVVVVTSHVTAMPDIAEPVTDEIYRIARRLDCPLVVIGAMRQDLLERAPQNLVAVPEPARAVRALHHAGRPDPAAGGPVPAPAPQPTQPVAEGTAVTWTSAQRILAEAGIATPPTRAVATAAEAAAAADELGYPVVLKIDSPQLFHRSRVGLVALGVTDRAAAAAAAERMIGRARELGLTDLTCLVQRQATVTAEVFVGVDLDEPFGPVAVVAAGGVAVETAAHTVLLPAPVTVEQARSALLSLPGPASGLPPPELAALAGTVRAVSRLAVDRADALASVEINPLCVTPDRPAGIAVDALMTFRAPAGSGPVVPDQEKGEGE